MDTDTTPNTDPTADHTCSPACNYCNVPTPAYTTPNTDPTGGHNTLPAGTVVESQDGRRLRGRVVGDGHPLSGWVWVAWQEYGTYDELIEDLTITVDTETETTTERTAEWYRSLAAHCDCEASEATWNEQYETAETWRCAEHVWLLAARATEDGQTQAAEWLANVASQDQAAAEESAAGDEDES